VPLITPVGTVVIVVVFVSKEEFYSTIYNGVVGKDYAQLYRLYARPNWVQTVIMETKRLEARRRKG